MFHFLPNRNFRKFFTKWKAPFLPRELSWVILLFFFDVTMEISPRQFHPGETGHTQKVASPWATAICSWVKRLQPYLIWWTWSHVKTLFRLRLAKQQLCTCVTLFLFIFLKLLHDCDVKLPSFMFVLGMTWTEDNNLLLLLKLGLG